MKRFTHRSKFNGDQWITGRWETDIKPPWIEPLDMIAGVHFVPQLVDKVGADVVRIDVEVSRFVRFNGASEQREVFENVSERRDEVENGLLNRMIRLGDRWEKVVDGGPDEGDDEVQGVNLYRFWAGEAEPGGGPHSDCCDDWLRHGCGGGEGDEGGGCGGSEDNLISYILDLPGPAKRDRTRAFPAAPQDKPINIPVGETFLPPCFSPSVNY